MGGHCTPWRSAYVDWWPPRLYSPAENQKGGISAGSLLSSLVPSDEMPSSLGRPGGIIIGSIPEMWAGVWIKSGLDNYLIQLTPHKRVNKLLGVWSQRSFKTSWGGISLSYLLLACTWVEAGPWAILLGKNTKFYDIQHLTTLSQCPTLAASACQFWCSGR